MNARELEEHFDWSIEDEDGALRPNSFIRDGVAMLSEAANFLLPAFVIAEHDRDFQRIANVVRYEGEHLVLYHNDRRRYAQTVDHSGGGGHPILQ